MVSVQFPGTFNGQPVIVTIDMQLVSIEPSTGTTPPPASSLGDAAKVVAGLAGAYLILK